MYREGVCNDFVYGNIERSFYYKHNEMYLKRYKNRKEIERAKKRNINVQKIPISQNVLMNF
jgi:hypothetical protein